ncbi:hypothetical protein [Pseudomonas serbica]|jgi:hypothetical protein|uniref:hypothetical protein n=1 Tax=Pseudomonas serbica TaxID=2965074 RepID=UPI00237C4370|nr:hypothetical protein [Pseudomonas serbica]
MTDNVRDSGYYWIRPEGSEEWMIGFWYEGLVDANGLKGQGHFDCSNHWDSDYATVYSPSEVGERLVNKTARKGK